MVDTQPYYDTSTMEFRLIKAFSSNDTNTLKQLVGLIDKMHTELDWQNNLDSCLKQQSFKDINTEEEYRFIYTAAFCPYKTSTTIIKYKDSTVLNTIVYQYASDTLPCKIIDQSTITIDSISWDKFQESLEIADFWGLKPDNGRHGFDGSTLAVYGFKRAISSEWSPDKFNFIERWCPEYNSIFNSFILLLKYSKTKKGCITAT